MNTQPSCSKQVAAADIVVLGLLPPPISGASKNTLLMLQELRKFNLHVVGIPTNTSGFALRRSLRYHTQRVRHFCRTFRLVRATGCGVDSSSKPALYFVPDGGQGAWYSLGYVLAANRRFSRVVLHHRTFRYIDNKSAAMQAICHILKDQITHVFLSDGMRRRFENLYGPQNAVISTNARFVAPRNPKKSEHEVVIGHLSNLCALKGFFLVADTFDEVIRQGVAARLVLAGPILEPAVKDRLNRLVETHGDKVEYFGALSGTAKDRFYDRLHVFLFPTLWRQEAQPNVIYEAFAGGASVIALGRGCIPEMIPDALGLVIDIGVNFIHPAAEWISTYSSGQANWRERQEVVHRHIRSERFLSKRQHDTLIDVILANRTPKNASMIDEGHT